MLYCDRSNTLTYFPHVRFTNTKTPPLLRPCWLSFTAGLENCRKSENQSSGSLRSRNVSVKQIISKSLTYCMKSASYTLPSSPSTFQFRIRKGILLKGTDCSLFVDDFALCVSGKTLNRVERAMQLCVNSVQKWVSENGFKFSTSKTVCIHFHQQYLFFHRP